MRGLIGSILGALVAWAVLRALAPGRDLLLGLVAAWGVVFRLWQREDSTSPFWPIYGIAGIVLLVAALFVAMR